MYLLDLTPVDVRLLSSDGDCASHKAIWSEGQASDDSARRKRANLRRLFGLLALALGGTPSESARADRHLERLLKRHSMTKSSLLTAWLAQRLGSGSGMAIGFDELWVYNHLKRGADPRTWRWVAHKAAADEEGDVSIYAHLRKGAVRTADAHLRKGGRARRRWLRAVSRALKRGLPCKPRWLRALAAGESAAADEAVYAHLKKGGTAVNPATTAPHLKQDLTVYTHLKKDGTPLSMLAKATASKSNQEDHDVYAHLRRDGPSPPWTLSKGNGDASHSVYKHLRRQSQSALLIIDYTVQLPAVTSLHVESLGPVGTSQPTAGSSGRE